MPLPTERVLGGVVLERPQGYRSGFGSSGDSDFTLGSSVNEVYGTWSLAIGRWFYARNLVLQSTNLTMSKERTTLGGTFVRHSGMRIGAVPHGVGTRIQGLVQEESISPRRGGKAISSTGAKGQAGARDMTYRVNDQLNVSLSLGGEDLAVEPDDVININLIEQAGTELPMATVVVKSSSKEMPRLVNENNLLEVSVGTDDEKDSLEAKFIMQRPTLTRSGADLWLLSTNGLKSTYPKWAKSETEISQEMSGIERILQIAERAGEKIDADNLSASNDKQCWIQYGCPNKVHMDEIWLHCDLGDSFPLLACTFDGFIAKDGKQLAREDPKHRFGNSGEEGYLRYDWSPGAEYMSGFFASVGARGQQQPIYDLSLGEGKVLESEPKLFMSGGISPFADDFDKVSNARRTLTRNMHPKYWESHAHNYTQIALYSSLRFSLAWKDEYRPVRPLDLVEVKEDDILAIGSEAAESLSGHYIVSKVARQVQGNSFSTVCQMTRECFNSNKKA